MSQPKNATASQFNKLLMRMMPSCYSCMGEGKLIAAILTQAWIDAEDKHSARAFFTDQSSALDFYCEKVGLNGQQIREIFKKHSAAYKNHMKELAA